MNGVRRVRIDRIELGLDGIALDDARLLAGELDRALAAQLQLQARPAAAAGGADTLRTALGGAALVAAVAARLADLIAGAIDAAAAAGDTATAGGEGGAWR